MTALQALTISLLAHVALTAVVGLGSLKRRFIAARSSQVRLQDIALDSSNWPDEARKFGNNFDNQFQVPTLWYAVAILSVAAAKLDAVLATLSWIFVATRVVHSYVHTGSNNVPLRMRTFLAGFTTVIVMWVWLTLRIFEIV